MGKRKKATHREINRDFLVNRAEQSIKAGFGKQKWVEFCEHFIKLGYKVTLYEARETVSKYVTIHHGTSRYKVRFSNHRPHINRIMTNDCDFYVGISAVGVSTTKDAIKATENFFKTRLTTTDYSV